MPKEKEITGAQRALAAVSQDEWRSLYRAAAEVVECEPWKFMAEDEIFVFVMPGGAQWFVSVMGLLGEYRAVAVYPVEQALHLFRQAHVIDSPELVRELAIGTPQLHLSYEGSTALEAAEKPLLKIVGVTAVSRRWPIARSIRPGYQPFILEPDEVEVLRTALEQLIAVFKHMPSGAQREPGPGLQELLVRRRVNGNWCGERRKVASTDPLFVVRLQHDWQRTMKGLRRGTTELQIDLIPLPGGIGKPGERLMRAGVLLVVDAQSGLVTCMEVLAPEPSWSAMRENVPAKVLQLIASSGERPSRIAVRAPFLSASLEPVCVEVDILLETVRELPALDSVLAVARQRGLL